MAFTLHPAVGEDFFNREKDIEEMLHTLKDKNVRMGFALIGPRRMGKSSILRQVAMLLAETRDVIPIYFSLWDIVEPRVENFCKKFTEVVLESFKYKLSIKYRIKQLVQVPMSSILEFLKSINIHIKILDEIEISLSKKEERDYTALIEKVMILPEVLANETKTKSVIFMDEFPAIIELSYRNGKYVGEGVIKKIRTITETYRHTVLNISGSIRKTMELRVLNSASPFFRQFIVKNVGPFQSKDVHSLLCKNLGRKIKNEVSNKVYEITNGIPFYVQFIGRGLLRLKNEITVKDVTDVFFEFLNQEGDLLFRQEFEQMSTGEKQIVYIMAKKSLTRISEIAKELNISLNVVMRYLDYLSSKGIIVKEQRGIYKFTDPIFERWVREIL